MLCTLNKIPYPNAGQNVVPAHDSDGPNNNNNIYETADPSDHNYAGPN